MEKSQWRRKWQRGTKPLSKDFPAGNSHANAEAWRQSTSGARKKDRWVQIQRKGWGMVGIGETSCLMSTFLIEQEPRRWAASKVERRKGGDFMATDFGNSSSEE